MAALNFRYKEGDGTPTSRVIAKIKEWDQAAIDAIKSIIEEPGDDNAAKIKMIGQVLHCRGCAIPQFSFFEPEARVPAP
jgi:hypothetical protein